MAVAAGDTSDAGALSAALVKYGLATGAEDVDATWLTAGGTAARAWPDLAPRQLGDLPDKGRRAVLQACAAAGACVLLRLRTAEAEAVARCEEGLRPLSQGGAIFYGAVDACRTSVDAPSAVAERRCLQTKCLIVRDEGAMYVFGHNTGNAFVLAYYLQKCCARQLLLGGRAIVEVDTAVWEHASSQMWTVPEFVPGVAEWPAVRAAVNNKASSPAEGGPDAKAASPVEGPDAKRSRPSCGGSEEMALRESLARAHRELNSRGFDELVWNHISAKLGEELLFTPGDRLWEKMEPSWLVRQSSNCTAAVLHAPFYKVTGCAAVVHTHAPAIEAVSCMKDGLADKPGCIFSGRVAYHAWEGLSDDAEEGPRLEAVVAAVPGCNAVILRNHGAITFGSSVEEALELHLALEAACAKQLGVGAQ